MYDVSNESKGGANLIGRDDIRCTAPGRFRHYRKSICGRVGARPKVTQIMVGRQATDDPQPMWLCDRHWNDYDEIGAISGIKYPKRPFPERG